MHLVDEFIKSFGFQWLSPVSHFSQLSSPNSFFEAFKYAKMYLPIVMLYLSRVFTLISKRDSSTTSLVVWPYLVTKIFLYSNNPKVSSTVIQCVSVDMINNLIIFRTHNNTVQKLLAWFSPYVKKVSRLGKIEFGIFHRNIVRLINQYFLSAISFRINNDFHSISIN